MSDLDFIEEAWAKHLESNFSHSPQEGEKRQNTWASAIRDCGRQMALDLIYPWEREEFPRDAMERMMRGRERDVDVSTRMTQAGKFSETQFDVELRQQRFEIRDRVENGSPGPVIVTGKVDGVIVFEHPVELRGQPVRRIPFEIKSGQSAMNVKDESDLNRSVWTAHFIDQLLMYVYAMNDRQEVPLGALLLEQPGLPLIIPVWLEDHLGRVEAALVKARAAWDVRHCGADLPAEVDDPEICWRCDHFRKSCAPKTYYGPGVTVVRDQEVIDLFDLRGEMKDAGKKFDKAHGKIKKLFADVDLDKPIIIGGWQLVSRERKDGARILKIGRIAQDE